MEAESLTSELTRRTFRVLEPAGSGASSDVFKAIRSDGAFVALKVARSSEGQAALAREASHAALALSPHLPELLDVGWLVFRGGDAEVLAADAPAGSEGARAFLALRWMSGRHPKAAPCPAESPVTLALRVASDVGTALADLHGVGLAHGDIKPENLLVDDDGTVRVLDLGLAGPLHEPQPRGGTPRYLALGDADLGDARSRDLIALGAVLAEIVDPQVAAAADPIRAGRAACLPPSLAGICRALFAPTPGARPSASWVSEMARAALPQDHRSAVDVAERRERRVRAAYLRVRRAELERATTVAEDETAPWLAEALARERRARSIGPSRYGDTGLPPLRLGRLSPEGIARWLIDLTGTAAASWPVSEIAKATEPAIARGLTELAKRLPPLAWTLRDVEAVVHARPTDTVGSQTISTDSVDACRENLYEGAADIAAVPLDADKVAALALSVGRVPSDASAIVAVERCLLAPSSLVLAAADALRREGQLGRARSLVLRLDLFGAPHPVAAEVLRRAGDGALAEQVAHVVIDRGLDESGRARATLARIALDRGDVDSAATLAASGETATSYEVLALVAARRGDTAKAIEAAERASVLARSPEDQARAVALRGYVDHGADPQKAHAAFTSAVDHAVRAGAVVEEATYRTGEAAAAVDLGELGSAISTSRRAALLWEHLGKPALAARALLATAAAYATAGASAEARGAALDAIARAREGRDVRAEAYAHWAIADVEPGGSETGAAAAERAASLLASIEGGNADDELRAAARLLRHGRLRLDRIPEIERAATHASVAPRLDWWGARAEVSVLRDSLGDAPLILSAITALADARAPIGARGPALGAAFQLATRIGAGDQAQRILSTLGEVARMLSRLAPPELSETVRALPWVSHAAATPRETSPPPERARDLEAIIRSFSDRERLGPLLNRIIDALVLWTGVERGLLLMNAPDGRLVPRAARNLARHDLVGEQIALSQSLARRALDAREPVVAFDAEGELSTTHKSVHALKLRSVLAVPLVARGETLGVVYLDDRIRKGAFGPREIEWAKTISSLAALVIADARDQVLLRRAARRAKRASAEIAATLSLREAALDAAERELAKVKAKRDTRFPYENIIGESATMRALLRLLDRVTLTSVPVLITGESGSGKELIARAIHDHGPRNGRPFVGENCGAIPEGLLESTLFGHVRGAFTGAVTSRAGLFEVADKGTLFLDEVGETTLGMQTKLLRILEDGLVRPVGTERARKVDVRIVTATNRDLTEMVKEKTFREDLFYRLNIITLRIPPLRERTDDIPLLVRHFLEKHGADKKARITPAAMDRLSSFGWPGNVRQLENEIRRALVLADGLVDEEHLSAEILGKPSASPSDLGLHVRRRVDALERSLVEEALERTGGNQTQAAKLLGLSRFGLQKMIKRLEIA